MIKMVKTAREVPVSRVLYKSLESRYEEFSRFSGEDETSTSITGSERMLIIIKDTYGDIVRDAYSVVGSFHTNNSNSGKILFQKEDIAWSDEDLKEVIGEGKPLEVLVRVNRKGIARLERRFDEGAVLRKIPLEEYLLKHQGGFANLKSSYARAKRKLDL